MENYKIIRKNQFACSLMQVRRDKKIPVALMSEFDEAIVSQAYPVFEVVDPMKLLPEYIMMWFSRSEFDREACFYAVGGVRGSLEWEDFCNMQLPVPSIEKQKEIVTEYNTIVNRIKLNEELNRKLEETAQAIYKQWFVDFEFLYDFALGKPDLKGKPYKSSGGEMVWNAVLEKEIPKGWRLEKLKNICAKIGSGSTPTGGKESYSTSGISLIRSTNVFDYSFSYTDLAFINKQQADKLKNVEVKENDILFNITGVSVARCCMVPKNVLPARVNQHVMIIRPFIESQISFYLLMNLCSSESKNVLLGISQSGSTREAITKSEIEDFKIIIPDYLLLKNFEEIMVKSFFSKNIYLKGNQKLFELENLILSKMTKVEVGKVTIV